MKLIFFWIYLYLLICVHFIIFYVHSINLYIDFISVYIDFISVYIEYCIYQYDVFMSLMDFFILYFVIIHVFLIVLWEIHDWITCFMMRSGICSLRKIYISLFIRSMVISLLYFDIFCFLDNVVLITKKYFYIWDNI